MKQWVEFAHTQEKEQFFRLLPDRFLGHGEVMVRKTAQSAYCPDAIRPLTFSSSENHAPPTVQSRKASSRESRFAADDTTVPPHRPAAYEPVEREVERAIDLVVGRQRRELGDGLIQDRRIRIGHEYACRFSVRRGSSPSRRRIENGAGVTDGAQMAKIRLHGFHARAQGKARIDGDPEAYRLQVSGRSDWRGPLDAGDLDSR